MSEQEEIAHQYELSEIGQRIAAGTLNQLIINGIEKMLTEPSVTNQALSKLSSEDLKDVEQEIQQIIADLRRKAAWYADLAKQKRSQAQRSEQIQLSILVGEAFRGWSIMILR